MSPATTEVCTLPHRDYDHEHVPLLMATKSSNRKQASSFAQSRSTGRSVPQLARSNRLLQRLPKLSRQRFLANCVQVDLAFAQVLGEARESVCYVYFPIDCFISLVTELDDASRLEVGIIGNEGMLGTSLILGIDDNSHHALVQGAGMALRMKAADFTRHCEQSLPLRLGLGRYVYVLLRQLALTSACTHYHIVEQRLARWLLLTRDRAQSDTFHLTHQLLSFMLGVRRVGVTRAATALHARGLINYERGNIVILDGAGLECASCRCYHQASDIYERVLGT